MPNARRDFSLRNACREIDDLADVGKPIQDIITDMGLDFEELRHVAEQRAMRCVLVLRGRGKELRDVDDSGELTAIAFDPTEQASVDLFTSVAMDTLAIGWRGNQLHEEEPMTERAKTEERAELKKGDWVEVLPEHDVPELLRPGGKPTTGRVNLIDAWGTGKVEVWIPIGGADVDEHSQGVNYPPEALRLVDPPASQLHEEEE